MEPQLVMLQNEAWGSTICGAMNGFRQTGEFCNVTLLSNDSRSFVAHDCVLAAASPYMKSLLTDMDLPSCMLKLETISGELIEYILQFIYSGMVCLPLTKLANIATASEQLGVDQLKTLCDGFLKDFDVEGNKQEEGGADLMEKESDSTDIAEGADVVDFTPSSKEEGAVCSENETEKLVTVKYEEPDGVDPVHDELTEREKDIDQPNCEVVEHGKDSKDNVASVQAVTECIPPMQLEMAGTTVDAETVAQQILELPPEAKEIIHSNVIVQPSEVVEGDVGEGSREQVIYVQPVNEVDIDGQGATKNDVMEGVAILQQLEDGSSGFIMTGNSGIIHVTLSQQPEGVDDPALQALTINTTVEGMAPTEPNKQSDSTSLLPRTTPMRPFACFRCNKTFTRRGHLTEHERVHTGDVYRCEICSKTFQWKRGLELHTRVHSGEKPYACDFCGKQFAHASNLMVHRKRHSGEKPYACSLCNMTFCSQSSLIRHRKRHSGVKAHKCEHCGKAFFERNVLKRHMRKHTGEKPYMCGVCGDRFTDVTGLSYHRWTHRKDRPLKCPTCSFGCISQSQLTSHMRTHTGERPFKCETCGKGFKIRANLTAHERIHSGERPFECCFCRRKFVTSSQLNKHAVTHVKQEEEDQSSAEQKPYQCSVCGKRFGRRNNMLQHERLHLGLKPFKCSACEWRFTRRTHLMKHQQKMQHGSPDDLLLERERKAKIECTFECNYCTGRFEDENSLMQHQIVCKGDDGEPIVDGSGGMTAMQSNDEGERQFRCNICTRTFKRSTHLKQHKKSHQRIAFFFSPEGRPYECDVCKKRFKRKNTLNQHKMTHRDDQERRHLLCYLCGRGFIRTTHLKTHVRTMHKDVKIPDEFKIKSDDDDDEEEGQLEDNE